MVLIYSFFVFYFVPTNLYSIDRDFIIVVLGVLKTPILLVIAILFFHIYRKIDSDDPFKRISLMATIAWFLLAISSVSMTSWSWEGYPKTLHFLIISGLQPIAWVLMVYSMVIRKAAMLTWKKRIARSQVLICPRCKNRIQEDWDYRKKSCYKGRYCKIHC